LNVPAPVLSLPRKLFYSSLLAGGTLVLLLGGLEAGLRLAGFGHSAHFFRRENLPGGETVWRENRWCTAPFFSEALVRRPQAVRLAAKKAAGTYRVFVLGDSAAMGDPEPAFSIGRMLEAMLRTAYPAVRFEVVNAAITAINSHVVRGIAADCARLEPDLFIVYMGNNEVIGPFGPSGVFAPFLRSEAAIRSLVWLKTTRTAQWLGGIGRRGEPAEWGGMEMFLKQQVAADDPRLDAVRAHFRDNLQVIAATGRRAGATTLFCTVLVNQRDFAPFLSRHRPDLTAAQLTEWEALLATAAKAQQAGDLPAAEAACRAAEKLDDQDAGLAFRLGRLELQAGHDVVARDLLQRALDLDTLRFRTDSRLNNVIREFGQPAQPRLEVVDLAATLAARSPHGIAGDELLYEHVHLTFRGAYEAAVELFPRIGADLVRRGLVPATVPVPFDPAEARVRLGFNTYEQAMIGQELLSRFRRPPFSGQADAASRRLAWERRAEQAGQLLARPDATPALVELARRALDLSPDDWLLARNTGAMFVARGDPAAALPLLERADRWIDDDVDTLVALGRARQAAGQTKEAEISFARARRLEPRYPGLPGPANPDR
jgi:tetratricopeptide (TPR) repeat protein